MAPTATDRVRSTDTWLPRVTAACWLFTLVYFPVSIAVAHGWPAGYRMSDNYISDLGITRCGEYTDRDGISRWVCSPDHVVQNVMFVLTGLVTVAGALGWARMWSGRGFRAGCALLAVAGLGIAGIGLAPWDIRPQTHDTIALVQWILQLAGMALVVPEVARRRRGLAIGTVSSVAISVIGGVFLFARGHFGLGAGISERIAFDTLTLWGGLVGFFLWPAAGRRSR
ncbi:DUF998 domain-containing protein [Nocardia sp. NEAU-G5]|uniref:DUF998 domain-containing protein n=1 Tax=Nocardia albiluteola TaxID=2842303 RepID=A0ABS6B9S6_9NOCA|nr:DUF998 domain-containing protein [Nocardia albiluteola]MBU3067047.1 DUF998 domain-containing protein [Nocardia albiluteola]